MFAITGITGQVGGATAETLLAAGAKARAVVRNPSKAEVWANRCCEIAVADMADAPGLASAFTGTDGVFILLPPIFDPSPGFPEAKAVIAAVREALHKAQPKRVVALSTVGAQVDRPNLLNQLRLLEQALASLDLPLAFIRAAWFMENSAWDVPSARTDGVIASYLYPPDRAIPMVATVDIGRLAARLLQGDWSGTRIIELAGPAVSPNDIAATFARLLKHPVDVEVVPRATWETSFRAQGMSNPLPRIQMLDGFNEGWIKFEGAPVAETAAGTTSLETVFNGLISR